MKKINTFNVLACLLTSSLFISTLPARGMNNGLISNCAEVIMLGGALAGVGVCLMSLYKHSAILDEARRARKHNIAIGHELAKEIKLIRKAVKNRAWTEWLQLGKKLSKEEWSSQIRRAQEVRIEVLMAYNEASWQACENAMQHGEYWLKRGTSSLAIGIGIGATFLGMKAYKFLCELYE